MVGNTVDIEITNTIHLEEYTDALMRGIMFPPFILIKRMSEEDIKRYTGGQRTENKKNKAGRAKQYSNLRLRCAQCSVLRKRKGSRCMCVRAKVSRQVEASNKLNQRNYAIHDDGKMFCAYVKLSELSQKDIQKLMEKKD
ncbi:Hypothetical protein CINCED_3A022167 [Cinara cedri]|uniref:Uncharacterized protein n=1 Tax=Cinara cedri TaxID=506608 RepID=A0A5E4MJC6_9HEMI|nr:Hypothetical protein CINCED_3A022167 [Cinara cedri]